MDALEKVTIFITRTIEDKTELLLFKHPSAGIQIPAGTVEIGESPLEAALREAYEETGLQSFSYKNYIGLMEANLPDDKFVVANKTKVYARPDKTSFDWAEFRRGIWVNSCSRYEKGFYQVEYEEGDRFPSPNYITYRIMGWVPEEYLSQKTVRHFFHFTSDDTKEPHWECFTDNNNFELFWAPVSNLHDIVEPQNQWIDYIVNGLGYNLNIEALIRKTDKGEGSYMNTLELFVEENWELTNVIIKEVLQETGNRKVLLIQATQGLFVVKIFNKELSEDQISRYTGVLVFLENNPNCRAPRLIKLLNGQAYGNYCSRFIYILEYIEGEILGDSVSEEYVLGQAFANLHKVRGCVYESCIDIKKSIKDMLNRFHGYPFKNEYDQIVKGLPDFNETKKCFIHTDVYPKNTIKNNNGEIVFIDFDDAGNGPLFIDLGYPLITQFVQFVGRKEGEPVPDISKLYFKYDEAKAFYEGYFSVTEMTYEEKELIFSGAVYMQLVYMPVFGEEAVPYLWNILKFAVDNKELLMSALGKGV